MVNFHYHDNRKYPHMIDLKKLSSSVTIIGPKLFVD